MKVLVVITAILITAFSCGCEKIEVNRSEFDMETPFVPKFDKEGKRIAGEQMFENDHNLRSLRNTEIKDQLKPEEVPLFRSISERLEAGDFASVKQTLITYLATEPEGEGLYRAYYLKARCEFELEEFDNVVTTVQKAYKKSPVNPYSLELVRILIETRKKINKTKKNDAVEFDSNP